MESESKIDYADQSKETFDVRKKDACDIKQKFPEKLPVIITKLKSSELMNLEKMKYLIPCDMTVKKLVKYIEKLLKLSEEKELVLYVNDNIIIDDSQKMSVIYEKNKSEDEFLRIIFSENTSNTSNINININTKIIQEIPDELIEQNLKILSELKPYEKLWITDNTIIVDNFWFQSYQRWMNSQSRDVTIETITKLFNYILQNKKNDSKIMELLKQTKSGLQNLLITYPDKMENIDKLLKLL